MKYGELTLGQIEAIVNKLGGMEGIYRLLRGELEVREVKKIIPPFGLAVWQKVYEALGVNKEEFSKRIKDLSFVEQPGYWTIPVLQATVKDAEGHNVPLVTCNSAVAALRKLGVNVYCYYEDLDGPLKENDRDPNRDGSYVISFRATIEADEENQNKSAEMLENEGHKGITLLERLLLEPAYFIATEGEEDLNKRHLDVDNNTLCTGSRGRSGCVPRVGWNRGGRWGYVDWYGRVHRRSYLRSRSVVSFAGEALPNQQ